MNLFQYCKIVVLLAMLAAGIPGRAQVDDQNTQRQWILDMKLAERGPFSRIRWFCADGAVLPPTPYACQEHGGGRQHGEYSDHTLALRESGYLIANLLVDLSPDQTLEEEANRLKWILLERFLYEADNGWILRKARYYRGAFQSEAESAAARAILRTMLDTEPYQTRHYLLLREAARLLPWQLEAVALDRVRALVVTIADNDPGFAVLRNKIHSFPEPADIQQVAEYRQRVQPGQLRELLDSLLQALEETFLPPDLAVGLRQLAGNSTAPDSVRWHELADSWEQANTPELQIALAGRVLTALREAMTGLQARQRQQAMSLSLAAEQLAYTAGIRLAADSSGRDRRWYLHRLNDNLNVLYGIGFLTRREWLAQRDNLAALNPQLPLADYRAILDYLARVPAWADSRLNYYFSDHLQKFSVIEPRVSGFIPDRLRGSPLVLHGRLLQGLAIDANLLTGVHHELFGRTVSLGLRSLNPGIARGPLQIPGNDQHGMAGLDKPVILAPETLADLPPVAGILTAREGNALSHIQLLARNLGIPNVVVSPELLPEIEQRTGQRVVLLSSPGGIVRLQEDGPEWDYAFPVQTDKPVRLQVDLEKLDTGITTLQSLADLRASDSGRIVGPKAAKLGELKAQFPDKVSAGLVLPFGLFRHYLDQTIAAGGPTLFEWMRQNYARLELITDAEARSVATTNFLTELRDRIRNSELDSSLRDELRQRMATVFGPDGSYGVFVRSDTNVEDLPGFTGAGLNLTVPNVVGFEHVIDAIKAVWASPFTERAYGWRQALMEQPEHVYVSVLLHQSVAAEKSGVMVTADITTNHQNTYSIAVNEGVGGGVEGQTAEALSVDITTGKMTLLSSAAEPRKRILPIEGGVVPVPASGTEEILTRDEITQLIEFGKSLPDQYPEIVDAEGRTSPADIEFAFVGGRLGLIQIRPFLQSYRAMRNRVLSGLDENLQLGQDQLIPLDQPPLPD